MQEDVLNYKKNKRQNENSKAGLPLEGVYKLQQRISGKRIIFSIIYSSDSTEKNENEKIAKGCAEIEARRAQG